MNSIRTLSRIVSQDGPFRIQSFAWKNGLRAPVSLLELCRRFSVARFDFEVTTPAPEALGGHVNLTIQSNGAYELRAFGAVIGKALRSLPAEARPDPNPCRVAVAAPRVSQ